MKKTEDQSEGESWYKLLLLIQNISPILIG